jgi:hypothetical protein
LHIHFNIILTFTPRSSGFPTTILHAYACHMSYPPHVLVPNILLFSEQYKLQRSCVL